MAKKEGANGGKKGVWGIIAIILVPILIIVMLAASFYAIIDGIVTTITSLVTNIFKSTLNFLRNPIRSYNFLGNKFL